MDNLADYKLSIDPLKSFMTWYDAASICEQNPMAMTLSTYDFKLNRPDARTVLFKGMEDGKLVFYTNYKSVKGLEIEKNNEVCLLFYWHESKRQVRIHGRAQKMSEEKSAQYFQSRDRESQLASWTSQQSQPIESKESLEKKLQETTLKFKDADIPLPASWGGYLIDPYEFEFFVYGDYRLNDRFLFQQNNQQNNKEWAITRLQP